MLGIFRPFLNHNRWYNHLKKNPPEKHCAPNYHNHWIFCYWQHRLSQSFFDFFMLMEVGKIFRKSQKILIDNLNHFSVTNIKINGCFVALYSCSHGLYNFRPFLIPLIYSILNLINSILTLLCLK